MKAIGFRGGPSIVLARQNNPKTQRICPVCDKPAQTKYLNHTTGKWIYRHNERIPGTKGGTFVQTHYHEAER